MLRKSCEQIVRLIEAVLAAEVPFRPDVCLNYVEAFEGYTAQKRDMPGIL